jgi:hypothetical protein
VKETGSDFSNGRVCGSKKQSPASSRNKISNGEAQNVGEQKTNEK